MNLFGGTFFLGPVAFLRWASSFRSLCGLFLGSSCGGSIATAKMRRVLGFDSFWWSWSGKGERDEENEISESFFEKGVREEESSIEGFVELKD